MNASDLLKLKKGTQFAATGNFILSGIIGDRVGNTGSVFYTSLNISSTEKNPNIQVDVAGTENTGGLAATLQIVATTFAYTAGKPNVRLLFVNRTPNFTSVYTNVFIPYPDGQPLNTFVAAKTAQSTVPYVKNLGTVINSSVRTGAGEYNDFLQTALSQDPNNPRQGVVYYLTTAGARQVPSSGQFLSFMIPGNQNAPGAYLDIDTEGLAKLIGNPSKQGTATINDVWVHAGRNLVKINPAISLVDQSSKAMPTL